METSRRVELASFQIFLGCLYDVPCARECTTKVVVSHSAQRLKLDGPAENAFFIFCLVQGSAVVKSLEVSSATVSRARVRTENSVSFHDLRMSVLQTCPDRERCPEYRDCRPKCCVLASHSRAHGL